MKIYVNSSGQITDIKDGLFVSNASWVNNFVKIYYNGNNAEVSYCNISFVRADKIALLDFMATIGEDDEGVFWNLTIPDGSPILTVTGQLQVSAHLVKAHYSEALVTKRERIATVTVAGFVQKNIGTADAEEYDRVLAEITEIRDDLVGISNDHESRISAIEDANPLVNFTSNVGSGIGTKYYYDGTTATVPLATGSLIEVPDVIPVSILTFSAGNWSLDEETDEYEIAFSGTTTGRDNNRYVAAVDLENGEGYEQTANKIYKGTDGSLLLSGVTEPFNGRVVLFGGTVQIDNDDGSEQNVIEVITRNSVVLPITDKTVNILVPESATDIEYGESTVGAELDDHSERLEALESALGDIATALDTINGEVI